MKALKPCTKFQSHPDRKSVCFWCGWDQVPHIIPDDAAFERAYWETLYSTGSGSGSVSDHD